MPLIIERNPRRSSFLLPLAGIFTILTGIVVITGWFLGIEFLESGLPGLVTMKFNTALCFIISGTSFLLLLKYNTLFSRSVCKVLLTALGIFAAVTFFQGIFGFNSGLDQLFITDYFSIATHVPHPGRMSPATSFCFILLAIGFLCVDAKSIPVKKTAQYILNLVSLITFVAIIGYIFKVPYSLKFSAFSSMAINTAIVFCVLSLAGAGINPNLGIPSLFNGQQIGNIIARRLFPRMILILVVIGYISIKLQHQGYINPESGIILSTVSFLIIGLFLIWDTLNEMNRLDLKRTVAENETQLLNKNLEDKVSQRTLALKQSNDRFLKIFNSNPTAIAMTKVDNGQYVDLNDAILDMLKYSREEIIGHTAADLSIISAEYRQHMVDMLDKQGFIKDADIVIKDKFDNNHHCILSGEMLEDENGKYMMTFVYDITERKIAQDNLQDAKSKLEILTDKLTNQNKQLTSFAHIISHNLRSPVSNLNLLVHFYKESESQEDKDELWKNFETVIEHLNGTLEDLLETLKIQEDTTKEREKLNFEKVFKGVQDVLIGQIKESNAVIKTNFSKATDVLYPKIYLESIMLNLVSNALKYKSPKRAAEITICTDNIDGQIVLTVQDNGLGIDLARHAKNLFGLRKTFHRHSEARGLGLFITKTQIEAMGGEITAESAVDEGTKFKVIFNKK